MTKCNIPALSIVVVLLAIMAVSSRAYAQETVPVYADDFFYGGDPISLTNWTSQSNHSYVRVNGFEDGCMVFDGIVRCKRSERIQVYNEDGTPMRVSEGEFVGGANVCDAGAGRFELGDYYSFTVEGGKNIPTTVSVFKSRPEEKNFVFAVPSCVGTLTINFGPEVEVSWSGQFLGVFNEPIVGDDNEVHIAALRGSFEFDNLRIGVFSSKPVSKPVYVNVDSVRAIGCDDLIGEPDLTLIAIVNGQEFRRDFPDDTAYVQFARVEFIADVLVAAADVELKLINRNPGPDQECDINPDSSKKSLILEFDVVSGKYFGDNVDVQTGKLITNAAGTGSEDAEICFAVSLGDYVAICDVDPTQAVFDVDIEDDGILDLALGRETGFLSFVRFGSKVDENILIDSELYIDGTQADSNSQTVAELQSREKTEFFNTLSIPGRHAVRVEVLPQNLNLMSQIAFDVDVKQVRDLRGSIMIIEDCLNLSCYPEPQGYQNRVVNGTIGLLKKFFPTPPNNQDVADSGIRFFGNPDRTPVGTAGSGDLTAGVAADMATCAFLGALRDPGKEFYLVGVSHGYLNYHLAYFEGVAILGGSVNCAIVGESRSTTGPHEICHMFGCVHRAGPIRGYDVENREPVLHGVGNLMAETGGGWPDQETFELLLTHLAGPLRVGETAVVRGAVNSDGTVQIDALATVLNGVSTIPNANGSHTLVTKNAAGDVIDEITFFASSTVVAQGVGEFDIGFAPFVLSIPYSDDAVSIEVQKEGKTLIQINPHSESIRTAVKSIPAHGFEKNPEQRRNALLNKVEALEQQLKGGNPNGACNELTNDIQKRVEYWLIDGYVVDSPLQFTKEEILQLIEDVKTTLGCDEKEEKKEKKNK